MGDIINSIKVFFDDMFTKKEMCDSMLKMIASNHDINVLHWSYENYKLFIWVDTIGTRQCWEVEHMLTKLFRQVKNIQHIIVTATNGDYIRCVKSENNSNIFSYGNRYDTDRSSTLT